MRKLKLFLATLTLLVGGVSSASAQETPESDGVYYIYNDASGLFLTRGENWGTQAVAKPIALPWKVSIADGKYTLRMYDLTVVGENSGFGSNCYSDNGSPIVFTPDGNAADGFTLKNGDNYITCPNTAGPISLSATESSWKFLTQAQYDAVLAAKVAAQESAIATLRGITIPDGKNLNDVVTDVNNWAASATVNDGVPTKDKWTATKHGDRGGNNNWNSSYGSEMYQCGNAHYTRTIEGLKEGIYKVAVRGMKRMANNENCVKMGNAGYPISDSYLVANGNIIRIKAWYEDKASDSNPNSTGDFVNIVNNGGYITEGFVYVGADGKLNLDASSEAYWGGSWFLFNGISYTYYNNEVSNEEATTILQSANDIKDSKMGNGIKNTLTSAITSFESNKTIANYNSLNAAITDANASINSYEALNTAIKNANNHTIYTTVFASSTTIYTNAVSTAQGIYDASTVTDCTDAITALTNGIYSAYENDYTTFANDYEYDYSTLLSQDLTEWASTDYVVMTANEHWNGQEKQRYYEQSSAEWGASSWNHAASETATLPAGKYVMSITARASGDVTSTMSVKVGDSEAITVALPNKGSAGRGVTTTGVGSYSDGTYANTNGRGWEYRFIAFELTEESPVTISFSSSTNASHNWVSIAAPLLKGNVHPNQIKVNQAKTLVTTLASYESKITAATYATFADHITAGNNATTESDNLDKIISDLQTDIEKAKAEAESFDRGAAMNALITGDHSVVLTDEASMINWSPAPTYNDWSTEADNTGMVTPFLQNWVAKDDSPLADNTLTYVPIRGLQNGFYEVSALVRVYAENSEEPSATSATFTVNETSVDLLDGTSFEYDNMKGVYKNISVRMSIEDALNISIAYSGANFNWISWKNLKVTYLGQTLADATDYSNLKDAITSAESKTIGFEVGEYAPYNNTEVLTKLTEAKTIDNTVINGKNYVQAIATALSNATSWTANTEEVNAVYDGTFAAATNDGAPAGWTMSNNTLGGAYHSRAFVGDDRLSEFNETKSGLFLRFDGTNSNRGSMYYYGNTEGYTMPLKADTYYRLVVDAANWGDKKDKPLLLYVTGPEGFEAVGQTINTKYDADQGDAEPQQFNIQFKATVAGNYFLNFQCPGSDDNAHNVIISNIRLFKQPESSVTMAVSAAKYATFCAPFEVTIPEGVEVYTVDNVDGSILEMTKVTTEKIDANKPVVIVSETAISKEIKGIAIDGTPTAGLLTGVYAETDAPIGSYVLQNQSGVVGFYKVAENKQPKVGANHAYLTVQTAGGETAREAYFFSGEATGIMAIDALTSGNATIFNAAGAQIPALQKGMNIVRKADGKSYKVIVK